MAECIDLMKIGGRKYRIRREPGEHVPKRSNAEDAAWYWELFCRHGFVYPYSKTHLAAYTNKPRIRIKLAATGLEVLQYGDTECVVILAPKEFAKVAKVLKPRKKRQLSEEQKQVLRERLAAVRAARGEEPPEEGEEEYYDEGTDQEEETGDDE